MAIIKATCPGCGEVTLTPGEVELRLQEPGSDKGSYAFICPECKERISKPANGKVIALLKKGDVKQVPFLPVADRPPWSEAPPIKPDDLLDFHHLLGQEDRVKKWMKLLIRKAYSA